MRIVVDMQGVQSTGSRNRGIGRYSMALALAMVRNRGKHEIILALNGLFPDTIGPIRDAFKGILPPENIRVWHSAGPISFDNPNNEWRRKAAELVREAFLSSIKPDIVHVSSIFEGFMDNAATSVRRLSRYTPTAITLYDLIPYIHPKPYLENPTVKAWYLKKLEYFRHADLWLSISESSRFEGIKYLDLDPERILNISTDADSFFQPTRIPPEVEKTTRQKYGLLKPFVMYTGGIDHRKNIERLIRAFAKLSSNLRKLHQLAIVCSIQPESRRSLEGLVSQQGLRKEDVIFTGYIPEDDLLSLYNLCKLFVFPSFHEGFGIPVLEAMRCGAPVIGSNTSSIPEVIGLKKALFDPYSDDDMREAIEFALSDAEFRSELIRHGKDQALNFSWDKSAQRAIDAMERIVTENENVITGGKTFKKRPKMAYVSPLPPERSGIANYSAELLPELSRFYEIEVVVAQDVVSDHWVTDNCKIKSIQWFIDNSDRYERVLYHFGNSTFHQHMFSLLTTIPGVVVLHDFFLSGIAAHMDMHGFAPGFWAQELYHSHGYAALYERFHTKDPTNVIWKYPCSLSVIQNSLGGYHAFVKFLPVIE